MAGRLESKIAVVTGGGSGIGRAACTLFAAEGAAVAVLDREGDAAEETRTRIEAAGGRAIAVTVDVTDAAGVCLALERVGQELGPVSVLYNNAGINSSGSILNSTEEDWDRCMTVNVKGTYLCSAAAARIMADHGGGAIVNQGSVAALVGVANFAAYCASKGAVVALTRSMAVDLAAHGIRVNVICPGTVYTPLMRPMLTARGGGDEAKGLAMTVAKYPIGRLGTPEDIARVALFLASDDAAFMTGSVVTPDGGMTAQ